MRGVASVVATMSLVMTTGAAMAADVIRPPVPPPAPVIVKPAAYDWHGCYFGLLGGYAWGRSKWEDSNVGTFSDDNINGWTGGGQVGCDVQHGALVFGAESQLYWTNITGAGAHTSGSDSWVDTTRIPAVLTITGRIGVAHDRTLWYVKGGAAGADVTYNDTGTDPNLIPLPGGYEYQFKHKRWGYLIGGGVEHALHGKWTLKAEFNYMNFGSREIVLNSVSPALEKPGQPTETFTSTLHMSQALVGLNYRF